MRSSHRLTTRVILLATLAAVLALVGAIVWAQGGADDPEAGFTNPGGASDDPEAGTVALPRRMTVVNEVELQHDPEAPSTEVILFQFIAGQSFHPRESTTNVQYGGGGCIYRTTPSGFVVADLQLPDGAEIDFARVYFDDTSADNELDFYLYSYDGMGAFTQLAMASSSGAPGQSSVDTGAFSHVVNNAEEALGLVVGMDAANSSAVRLCGVRVRYTVEVPSYTFLPSLSR